MRQTLRLLLFCAVIILAQTRFGWAKDPKQGVEPKEGFVPTADVARAIAEAVLVPVYGKEVIVAERPFKAVLKKDVWIITGSVPCKTGAVCVGGAAQVRISRKTGQVLHMTHTK